MFHMAELMRVRIAEVEGWPNRELMEWAAYLRLKAKGGKEMNPDQLLGMARTITEQMRRRRGRG